MEDIDVLPEDLRGRSLNWREIVVSYEDALLAIDHLLAHRWAILGWEGWILHPDGRVGRSLRHQGTGTILRERGQTWDEYMESSAAFCRDTMRADLQGDRRRPEVPGGTLVFALSAMSEAEGMR